MSRLASPTVLALLGGVILAFASIPLLGFTSAIAAPTSLFGWLRSHGLQSLGLLLWQATVVFGLGIGVGLAALLTLLWRASPEARVRTGACAVGALLAALYVVIPRLYGHSVGGGHGHQLWSFGAELAVGLSIAAAFLASRRGA